MPSVWDLLGSTGNPVLDRLGGMGETRGQLMLPPAQENQFQAFMNMDPRVREWRLKFMQKYGEPPAETDSQYDYRAAWRAGEAPEPVPYDVVPHWGSTGKSADHPTEWKAKFMDKFGVDPDEAVQTGKITPAMDAFIRAQANSMRFTEMLQGFKPR